MAKKIVDNSEDFTPENTPDFAKPPEPVGFQDVAAERAAGWFQPEPGAWFVGRLLGRFVMNKIDSNGKRRAFYQVKVSKGSGRMVVGKGDESSLQHFQEGQVIAFDERKALETLSPYADSDGIFDCFVHCMDKEKIDGGKTFWRFRTSIKTIKPPSSPLRPRQADDDDLPF